MAVSTPEASKEKTDIRNDKSNALCTRSITNKQSECSRSALSLDFNNCSKVDKSAPDNQNAPWSLSSPMLSSARSHDEIKYSTKNVLLDNEFKDDISAHIDKSKSLSSGDIATFHQKGLNVNIIQAENGESNKNDVILFIDNVTVENNNDISIEDIKVNNNCDDPLSGSSFASFDKISLEENTDAQSPGQKWKKYSASSHKVQFADMAVFDGEGEIHLSPRLIKNNSEILEETEGFCDNELAFAECLTICTAVSGTTKDEKWGSEKTHSKSCTCPISPKRNSEGCSVNINNNNGCVTNIQDGTFNTTTTRERTMSECSYFSNVSSVSLASKITNGTESSDTSSSSSSSSTASFSHVAPDGGWGWVIVFASFLVNMIADGVTFSVGVMFVDFQKEFAHSKFRTAGVIGLFHAIPLLSGPIASALTDRYGCRKVTIAGSIIATIGFLLSSLANSLEVLYLTFGIISGFGLSLCYVAALVIVAYYFERRRSFATGISVCGSGVGTFVFAPLTRILIEEYGWRGACVILAGCFLNMCVCGALFRDLEWTVRRRKRKKMKHKLSITKSISPIPDDVNINRSNHKRASFGSSVSQNDRKLSSTMGMPEIEALKIQILAGADLSTLYSDNDVNEATQLTSSLCHLPTWISNVVEGEASSRRIPQEFLTALSRNKKACHMIKNNYPDSLIALSLKDSGIQQVRDATLTKNANIEAEEISIEKEKLLEAQDGHTKDNMDMDDIVVKSSAKPNGVEDSETPIEYRSVDEKSRNKLSRKVSGFFKKCQNPNDTNNVETVSNPKSILKKQKHVSYERDEDKCITTDLQEDKPENRSLRNAITRSYSCRRTSGTDALVRQRNPSQQRNMYLNRLKMRRQSLTYRGAMLNISRYRLRSSTSCPDIFRNSMTTLAAEELTLGMLSIFCDYNFIFNKICHFIKYCYKYS